MAFRAKPKGDKMKALEERLLTDTLALHKDLTEQSKAPGGALPPPEASEEWLDFAAVAAAAKASKASGSQASGSKAAAPRVFPVVIEYDPVTAKPRTAQEVRAPAVASGPSVAVLPVEVLGPVKASADAG